MEGTDDCSGPQRMQLVPSEALGWRSLCGVAMSNHVALDILTFGNETRSSGR